MKKKKRSTSQEKPAEWKIKDLRIICYNLLQKVEPFNCDTLNKFGRYVGAIKKEFKVNEFEALQIMKKRLEQKYRELREHG